MATTKQENVGQIIYPSKKDVHIEQSKKENDCPRIKENHLILAI